MMRHRGFSLIELAVAMAIAGLITAAATTATVSLHRSFTGSKRRVQQSIDARLTLEYILGPTRKAGGGFIRPWQAISTTCDGDGVHTLPACAPQQQRLHVLEAQSLGQGIIASASGSTIKVTPVSGACPIVAAAGYVPIAPGIEVNVALVPPESKVGTFGAAWTTATCRPLTAPDCGCTLLLRGTPGFNPPRAGGGPLSDSDLVGGVVSIAMVQSFYIEPSNDQLMVLTDLNNIGEAKATALIPKAVAFEARYGYDDDNNGSIDLPLVAAPTLTKAASLRTMRIGLALKTRAVGGTVVDAPFFDGRVARPNQMILSSEGTATMRASAVFQ